MGYIAKAYVSALTEDEIVHLTIRLEQFGYRQSGIGVIGRDRCIAINDGLFQGLQYSCDYDFIDCRQFTPNGTEEEATKLFLELAQMQDDAGSDARWIICDLPHFDDMYNKTFRRGEVIDSWKYQQVDMGLFSVATPLEVAQAFKEGRI